MAHVQVVCDQFQLKLYFPRMYKRSPTFEVYIAYAPFELLYQYNLALPELSIKAGGSKFTVKALTSRSLALASFSPFKTLG